MPQPQAFQVYPFYPCQPPSQSPYLVSPADIYCSSLYNNSLVEYDAASTTTSQHYVSAISSSRETPGQTYPEYVSMMSSSTETSGQTYPDYVSMMSSSTETSYPDYVSGQTPGYMYPDHVSTISSSRETPGYREAPGQTYSDCEDLDLRVSVQTQTNGEEMFRKRTNTCPEKMKTNIQRTRSSYSHDRELTGDKGQTLYKPTSLEEFKNLIRYNKKSSKTSIFSSGDKRFSVIQEESDQARRESLCSDGTLV